MKRNHHFPTSQAVLCCDNKCNISNSAKNEVQSMNCKIRSFIFKYHFVSSSLWSRKLNKKPLTILLAKGWGMFRHNRPSTYATIPDNTNFPNPHFHINFTFCCSPLLSEAAFSRSVSSSSLHFILPITFPDCFRSSRIIKLTNRCSQRVRIVGPSFQSCH